ncbi:MAG: hypothetical protein R3C03_19880 [Pirellulaceae bacterium]
MSSESSQVKTDGNLVPSRILTEPLGRLDRLQDWVAEVSPAIFVKETRQALKSRQFVITFLLLLAATVFWSFLGTVILATEIPNSPGGFMASGFFMILAFPLGIVVPFSAYRSLSREFEEDTLQLVSITQTTARGIIAGKLGSSLLQMLMYLSAVLPGLAYAYLMQGIDLEQLWYVLSMLIAGSIGEIGLSLGLAALARRFFLRVISMLVNLAALVYLFVVCCVITYSYLADVSFDEFVYVSPVVSFIAIGLAALGFEAAVSLVSFEADNRSTGLRRTMSIGFVVFACLFGAVLSRQVPIGQQAVPVVLVWVVAWIAMHYWLVLGAFMSAESPGMSKRVRRELPKTVVGHLERGLLMPGPGRGYLCALAGIWGWFLAAVSISLVVTFWAGGQDTFAIGAMNFSLREVDQGIIIGTILSIYLTAFLSLFYLLGISLYRFLPKPRPVLAFICNGAVFALANITSVFLLEATKTNWNDYNLWAIACPYSIFFTTFNSGRSGIFDFLSRNPLQASALGIVAIVATGLTLFSLWHAVRELAIIPNAIPQRVLDEMEAAKAKKQEVLTEESIEEIFEQHQSTAQSE